MHSVKRRPFGISIALDHQSKTICWGKNATFERNVPSSIPWACNPMKSCEHFVKSIIAANGREEINNSCWVDHEKELMRHNWCLMPVDNSAISILYTNKRFPSLLMFRISAIPTTSSSHQVPSGKISWVWDQGAGKFSKHRWVLGILIDLILKEAFKKVCNWT